MRESAVERGGVRARLQLWIPVVVTAAVFAWLLSDDDIALTSVVRSVSPQQLAGIGAALLAYGAVGLALEALALVRMVGLPLARFSLWTAARIKAASYLAYALNYSVGIGALSVLLRRRAGLTLLDSAGVVLLIAAFDLGLTLLVASTGALLATDAPPLRRGLLLALGATMVLGFVALRLPLSLGPLDRLRNLTLFRATRETPSVRLAELFAIRLLFVSSFFAMAAASLYVFGIRPPLEELIVNISIVVMVAALPIAVAGLGTGNLAFVEVFSAYGDRQTLFGCSLALWGGLILLRAGMGAVFAREWAREALRMLREEREEDA